MTRRVGWCLSVNIVGRRVECLEKRQCGRAPRPSPPTPRAVRSTLRLPLEAPTTAHSLPLTWSAKTTVLMLKTGRQSLFRMSSSTRPFPVSMLGCQIRAVHVTSGARKG